MKQRFPQSVSRFILLGIGTANSPRFAAAGLLVEYGHVRVGIDGGPGSEPPENVDTWLVRDEQGALLPELRRIAAETGMPAPAAAPFGHGALKIEPHPVAGQIHGYQITIGHHVAVWAAEAPGLAPWTEGTDLVFADGSGAWLNIQETARAAKRMRVRRLVFVHLGDAALAALDRREQPLYGEWGEEGRKYRM